MLKRLLCVSAAAVLAACASSSQIRGHGGAPPELSQYAPKDAVLLWVPSGGTMKDAGEIARVSLATDENVRRMADQLRPAATTPVQIAVAGDNSSLTKAVTLAALSETAGQLPMLELTFLGAAADADAVKAAVENKKGRFAFKPWP